MAVVMSAVLVVILVMMLAGSFIMIVAVLGVMIVMMVLVSLTSMRMSFERVALADVQELDTWGGQIEEVEDLAVDEEAAAALAAEVNANRKPCPNLWYHAHIHWDGVLVSCSRDYDAITPLGNVKNGGVRLLDLPDAVPAEVKNELTVQQQAIVDGTVKVSAIADANEMKKRLDELFPR